MKKITALCLAALLILTLSACTSDRYKLTIKDREELLYEQPSKKYQAGEQVVIKTHILYDADIECFVNGESIGKHTVIQTDGKYTHWEYYFEMPAENVTVTFKVGGGKSG